MWWGAGCGARGKGRGRVHGGWSVRVEGWVCAGGRV